MSVFISPNDYTFLAGSCVKTVHNLCGHNYQLWCLQGSEEKVNDVIGDIIPTVERMAVKHSGLSFDKILLMSIVDYLVKYEKTTKGLDENNKTVANGAESGDNDSNETQERLEKQLQKMQKENEKLQIENEKQKQLYYDNLKKIMETLIDVKKLLLTTTEENIDAGSNFDKELR